MCNRTVENVFERIQKQAAETENSAATAQ
jgi:hypothetical protein